MALAWGTASEPCILVRFRWAGVNSRAALAETASSPRSSTRGTMISVRRLLAAAGALLAAWLGSTRDARAEETILFFERRSQTVALRPVSQGGNVVTDTSRAEIMVALG